VDLVARRFGDISIMSASRCAIWGRLLGSRFGEYALRAVLGAAFASFLLAT
jgi:hypothetical protein